MTVSDKHRISQSYQLAICWRSCLSLDVVSSIPAGSTIICRFLCGFICISLCQRINITPANLYMISIIPSCEMQLERKNPYLINLQISQWSTFDRRVKHSSIEPKDTLTHWGRVTHICVGKLTIIGSDNDLSPERREAIIWTNAGVLLTGPLETNFIEILIDIQTFSLKAMGVRG